MRDLVVLLFTLAFIPLSLRSGFAGYLLWGWSGLIALNSYVYGFMANVPYVQIFALLTFTTLFLRREPLVRPFGINRTNVLMLLFLFHGLLCALLAYPNLPRNWELFGNLAKTVLFCLLMPVLAVNRRRIHALVIMLALAVSFHGALDGLKFIASGGVHKIVVLPKFGDNNQLALVLLMVLPMLYYLFHWSGKGIAKLGFGVGLLLTVLAIVSSNSRGALLGLVGIGIWVVLQARHKVQGIAAILVMSSLVAQLAPDSWTQRMETMESAQQDDSFMGRVAAWKVSSSIAMANPVFGGGFRALQSLPVWDQFVNTPSLLDFVETPILERGGVAAHSIWFEVMGDTGFVGLLLFVLLIANAFVTRREIRLRARALGGEGRWITDLSDMLAASIVAYVVSGSLLSAAYFELPYIFMMMMEVLRQYLLNINRNRLTGLAAAAT